RAEITQDDSPCSGRDRTYHKSPAMAAKQQAREQAVVKKATTVLLRQGWGEFTIDKVLASAPLSRGTLYKHFRNREDLGLAIAVELIRRNSEFVNRIKDFKGSTRERYLAQLGAFRLYYHINPEHQDALIT